MGFKDYTTQDKNVIDKFIGRCLMSVTCAHIAHFNTKSYAQHQALGEFYEQLQSLIDTFVETHIGMGNIYNPGILQATPGQPTVILRDLVSECDSIYNNVDSALQNTLDEIKQLCYQTLYRLNLS